MRTLTTALEWRRRDLLTVVVAAAMAAGVTVAASGSARAECPWVVQPHAGERDGTDQATLVNIIFDGVGDQARYLYGFTVTDLDLAWTLSSQHRLPDLRLFGRSLGVTETDYGQAFRLNDDTLDPHTVYLVAAHSPVRELEEIDAAIEPSQPLTVSFKTRGATDFSGPLPRRSLPGVEIRASKTRDEVRQWLAMLEERALELGGAETTLVADGADSSSTIEIWDHGEVRHDVQICAYQVAMR